MAKPTSYELEKLQTAKTHGYSFFLIKGDKGAPDFLYTVGMAQKGLPDILMFLDSQYVKPQMTMISQLLDHLIHGVTEGFSPDSLKLMLDGAEKTVSDPEITYHFDLLDESNTRLAVRNFACRCNFFREVLGEPSILVISSDFNVTWDTVKDSCSSLIEA